MDILLKASLAIAVAFLFYKLVLQQESFFATNRVYLLGCLFLAFTLPNIPLPKLVEQQGYIASLFEAKANYPQQQIDNTQELPASPTSTNLPLTNEPAPSPEVISAEGYTEQPPVYSSEELGTYSNSFSDNPDIPENSFVKEPFDLLFWITSIYLFGVVIFSLSLFFQIGAVWLKTRRAKDKINDGKCIIVNTVKPQAPCSFFNYVFIYPDDYDFEAYEQIIAHEKTHVKLGHTYDLLFAEIAVILLWFNPLIWLFRKEIEKNIEYQTDSMLLEKEQVGREKYQLNLLQIAVPNKPLNITTNYNQSLIKQRIIMMNSKKSTPHAYWKYAFLFPVFFATLLMLNEPAVSQEIQQNSKAGKAQQKVVISEQEKNQEIEVVKENLREKTNEENVLVYEEGMIQETVSAEVVREPLPLREPVRDERQILSQEDRLKEVRTPVVNRQVSTQNIRSAQTDMTKGLWYSTIENGKYCIQFRGSRDASTWNMSECFEKNSFTKKSENSFVLTKETGTLELTGNLDAEVGQGKYTFTEDASFNSFLSEKGITAESKNLMFHLFLADVDKAYVTYLKKEYPNVDSKKLRDLAIHGVTIEKLKNYIALFQKHNKEKPSVQNVLSARIHGLDEAYVKQIQSAGFPDASLQKMMQAKIHGVDAAYVQSLKNAGYQKLSLEEVVSARIHGVDPEAVNELESLGYGKLNLQEVMQLRIHEVDAAYVNRLKTANLGDLSLDQVLQAKIHGLDPETINKIKSLGYPNLNFSEILTAKIHDVDVAYVEDIKKAGFKEVSMNDLVSAKIHGIDSRFIEEARKNGYELNSLNKYISLKIHDRAMKSLKNK